MHQVSRLNLEDVIGHLLGRDASLSWVYAPQCTSEGLGKSPR